MSKIYLVAIKWDMAVLNEKNSYKYVVAISVDYGEDIAGFTERYTYKNGWRIYIMPNKKMKQNLIDTVLGKK